MPLRVIVSVILRSLFVQAAWNFKGMQNIGFTFAMMPALKYHLKDRVSEGIERMIPFFNTQPYMAPTVMGVYLHLYERGQADAVDKIGRTLQGTLAALGDTFFWASLKPVMALLLLLCVLTSRPWYGLAVFAGYNAIHIWIMTWGFLKGYRKGMEGALEVGRAISIERSGTLSLAVPFLCGSVFYLAADRIAALAPGVAVDLLPARWSALALAAFVFALGVVLSRMNTHVFWFVYGVFAISVLWTMLQ